MNEEIERLSKLRREAELRIGQSINKELTSFFAASGLMVSGVSVYTMHPVGSPSYVAEVELRVELPR
jgi:hypothetical protein